MASFLEQNEGLDLFISRWNAEYDDPDSFTYGLFHSHAGLYRAYFSSPEADQIFEEARAENRAAAREALYRRVENLLTDSGILVPLFHDIDYRLANPKVRGLKLRSVAPYVNYSELGKVESAATVAEPLGAAGGILQVPISGVLNSLDPTLATSTESGETLPSIVETLTLGVGGRIVPWLAAEFRVEEGRRRYRFHLRDDVRFHDGRRLTARDVRYSFERLLQNRDSECRWFYSPIREVTGWYSALGFLQKRCFRVSQWPILSSIRPVSSRRRDLAPRSGLRRRIPGVAAPLDVLCRVQHTPRPPRR